MEVAELIKIYHSGDLSGAESFLKRSTKSVPSRFLEKQGKEGVERLREATPKDTGKTANSWEYKVSTQGATALYFDNTNQHKGKKKGFANVAILIQYGHATPTGGYVQGRDYINPALEPVFKKLKDDQWTYIVGKEHKYK